jgi:hypothetical protein
LAVRTGAIATPVLLDELEAVGFLTLFETNPLKSYDSVSTTITAMMLAIQAHRESGPPPFSRGRDAPIRPDCESPAGEN